MSLGHTFQELGMIKKKKKLYLQTMSASEFNNSMKMQTSDQHYSLHAA